MLFAGGMLIWKSSSRLSTAGGSGLVNRTVRQLSVLRVVLDCFKDECGRYPTTEEGLPALIGNPGIVRWAGPYVNLIKPDTWKNPYIYMCNDGIVTLLSCGPDGQQETADDIFPEMALLRTIPR